MNRLTISLPDDLYAMARAHAISTKTSLSKAIGDLLRQRIRTSPKTSESEASSNPRVHPETGFPLFDFDPGVTMEDIQRAIDDEDVRHLEMMGLTAEDIERSMTR